MAIISFSKDTIIEFIPAFGGNRESENPCVVRLKFISHERVQEYSKILATKARGANDGGKIVEASHQVQKKQFIENIESVSGFTIDGRECASVDEFYANAPEALVIEIIRAMEDTNKLTEGQRKNS